MTNRKKAEDYLLTFMGKLTKGKGNVGIYSKLFGNMTDVQFKEFVDKLDLGLKQNQGVPIWVSNYDTKERLVFDHIVELAAEYGLDLEQQLIMTDEDTGIEFVTPHKCYTGIAEVRKQRQMLIKKFGGGKDDNTIDDLTGQVVGESRGSSISAPEAHVLLTLKLPLTLQEQFDIKGGDLKALDSYRNDLITTGTTTVSGSLKRGSGVKSLKTLNYLLHGRMIDSTLGVR